MSNKITVQLSKPIKVSGEMVSSLSFREPLVADIVASDAMQGEVAKSAVILAGMAEISYPEFKALSARDYLKIADQVGHLMGNEPPSSTSGG